MDTLQVIWNAISGILNTFFNWLLGVVDAIFFWLPDDPFSSTISTFESFCSGQWQGLSWLNWFFPVDVLFQCLGLVVTCFAACLGFMLVSAAFDWIRGVKQTINPGG